MGSRTSSRWDLDSLADLLEEESEDSWDQDAEASSSPWVRKTKGFWLGRSGGMGSFATK